MLIGSVLLLDLQGYGRCLSCNLRPLFFMLSVIGRLDLPVSLAHFLLFHYVVNISLL